MQLASARLDPVIEQDPIPFRLAHMHPGADPAALAPHLDWLTPAHYRPGEDALMLSHHSWLVRTAAGTVLVDPCVGNGRDRPALPFYHRLDTPWLERLNALGLAPEDIDFVVCTHLHVDHCGWNTRLEDGRWVPAFPNARYVFSRLEHDYWAEQESVPAPRFAFNAGVYADSVKPVVDAGLALLVEDVEGFSFAAGFTLMAAPGHTPGHMAVVLDAGADGALFCGDVVHSPVQICFPDWRSSSSFDDQQAIASRRRVLDMCADSGYLLATAHFPAPHACRIERDGVGAYRPHW